MFFTLKVIISGLVIGLVTEVGKKNPAIGGWIAALPLITLLSVLWLFVEQSGNDLIHGFLLGVLKGLIPSALMLTTMIIGLRCGISFIAAVIAGIGSWAACTWAARHFGWL